MRYELKVSMVTVDTLAMILISKAKERVIQGKVEEPRGRGRERGERCYTLPLTDERGDVERAS